ncbi:MULTISPECIES: 4-amino-4-deoxy-L-arabinose-phosphoundecaprenol flippase subunit ArnE [unclassified Pseudomonas]|uniref:4-amino-4-deoxy-L-arabinose-phosphoundecaprenol flippase subunit ArnE n=1 Tax=unclassified Pseudomonas TaxID=196821 RepID=UPI002AC948DF|nr:MULTISPECIES: 4-amino-4-deoxy-L-arabinose-phosphoundecaprenol flippase subunit ArnE [unclassified Pseudomonas]MEB0045213.1 4-amino-4-deoxy-L-arabinose-phosphoundecaprenol flippase subunit ArnE [Pseudomonas sp. Dout3]MEB0096431.1 4-amino-4-deoxy-L-arabinose-phosphoundecaprenol flippase subunit ArnE [Pseudomonas sp. DC1.2]WPX61386.1 4-amino-4-deoxy-L-arabinose-phosphoundecaprenol flippase subunit ArnE [Pseudomonas sp. DC1.2]
MSLLLLLTACLLTCLGQIAQKYAVESWRGKESSWSEKLCSPWLWLALLSLGFGLLVWLLVLQRLEVGVAYPMLSLNFVLITLVARFVFHEAVDRRHWLGVALVIGGVILLGQHA